MGSLHVWPKNVKLLRSAVYLVADVLEECWKRGERSNSGRPKLLDLDGMDNIFKRHPLFKPSKPRTSSDIPMRSDLAVRGYKVH